MKKFISPYRWFSVSYPDDWMEAEDEEGSFLFYNPDRWNGNLRISASKDRNPRYAFLSMKDELKSVSQAVTEKIGTLDSVCSSEIFEENGCEYTIYYYVTGKDNLSVTFSFTVGKGLSDEQARKIISTLYVYPDDKPSAREVIPVRIWEIHQIDEAYDWVMRSVKKMLKKDFTGEKHDLGNLQQLVDSGLYNKGQRETWEAIGIAFGVILTNEMDGMHWVTVVDGKKEFPALEFEGTDFYLEPMRFFSMMVSRDEPIDFVKAFENIKNQVEDKL